jgi:ribosomal protein L37AE/L43A
MPETITYPWREPAPCRDCGKPTDRRVRVGLVWIALCPDCKWEPEGEDDG